MVFQIDKLGTAANGSVAPAASNILEDLAPRILKARWEWLTRSPPNREDLLKSMKQFLIEDNEAAETNQVEKTEWKVELYKESVDYINTDGNFGFEPPTNVEDIIGIHLISLRLNPMGFAVLDRDWDLVEQEIPKVLEYYYPNPKIMSAAYAAFSLCRNVRSK